MIETKIQMRFADVDMLRHVNNINQQHYFDLGKNDFCAQVLGLDPYWETEGMIIVSTQSNYKSQIRLNEPMIVQTQLIAIGNKSFTLHHQLLNAQTREVKTVCTVVMVAYNFTLQQSIAIPSAWREKLQQEVGK